MSETRPAHCLMVGHTLTVGTALVWLALAPGLAWAVVRLAGLERGPLVQLLAFTPYVAALSLVPLGLALGTRHWWAAGLALAVAVALAAVVLPRALADQQPARAGEASGGANGEGAPLRVLTANLLFGGADLPALVALVRERDVDLLAVQELTPEAQAGLERHGLATLLPYQSVWAQRGAAGSGLYSRYPVREVGVRVNPGGFRQAYAIVDVPSAAALLVESAHPCAPYALSQEACWRADLAGQPRATPGSPVRVLLGDFNATLDHAPLRDLLDSGYADAAAMVGAGLVGTWGPYDGDLIPPVTLDHVLVDQRVSVRGVEVLRLAGSDHRPVLAELTLPGRAASAG